MRLSHDRIWSISQKILNFILHEDDIEYFLSEDDLRVAIQSHIEAYLKRDEALETKVRQKITSIKRNIPEGSAEWEALFDRYYNELLEKMG